MYHSFNISRWLKLWFLWNYYKRTMSPNQTVYRSYTSFKGVVGCMTSDLQTRHRLVWHRILVVKLLKKLWNLKEPTSASLKSWQAWLVIFSKDASCKKNSQLTKCPKYATLDSRTHRELYTCLQRNQREETSCFVKLRRQRLTKADVTCSIIGSVCLSTSGSFLFL